jgi:hypothetical protein
MRLEGGNYAKSKSKFSGEGFSLTTAGRGDGFIAFFKEGIEAVIMAGESEVWIPCGGTRDSVQAKIMPGQTAVIKKLSSGTPGFHAVYKISGDFVPVD